MKNCENFRGLIPQYAAGELDAKPSAKLQLHIAKCPDCSALLDAQKSGKLYIIGTAAENAPKNSRKRKIIVFTSIAAFIVILVAVAVTLRLAGFVRIASVTVDELSLEYVQSELPELYIDAHDFVMAVNLTDLYYNDHLSDGKEPKPIFINNNNELHTAYNFDDTHLYLYYQTAFRTFLLSWKLDENPTVETMSKSIYSRFKIFDIIKETRYTNHGNEHFSEYTATIDLWGTLTRQELD